MNVTHLECSKCGVPYEPNHIYNLCTACGKPLLVRYDLKAAADCMKRNDLKNRVSSLWRYREVLPVVSDENIVTLGEGWTPLIHASRLGQKIGLNGLYIKDEALNPTGAFKARGLCLAVSMAKELGIKKVAIPSAGNAAGAMAAYAARAGMEAYVFMPVDTPVVNRIECVELGAHVTLINGLITDCGAEVAKRKEAEGWFDVSTLKEPYRIEGKKTMGYELAEQFNWELPDVILYPTGGGTGLVGMWKAFDEMEQMGWIGSKRPRMYTVQATGCAPIVRAFENGWDEAPEFENAHTVASGLRVPRAIGDFILLNILRTSGGGAVAVTDEEMITATREIGSLEGMFCAPEGAACLPVLRKLIAEVKVTSKDRVVIFNTGAGMKYLEAYGLKTS
ncbi:MAG: threonine synthase [Acidobacteria bacterium]|nr:threonine synthase [Acidobacteriota bacterium]